MAVVIASDDTALFATGLRRSHSQPKFSSKQTSFRESVSASCLSDLYHQQQYQQRPPVRVLGSPILTSSVPPSPSLPADHPSLSPSSPSKPLVPALRLPPRLDRPGYGSSPVGTDDGTEVGVAIDNAHYDGANYFHTAEDPEPPLSPHDTSGGSYTTSPNDNNTVSTGPSRTDSYEFDVFEHIAEDDTAVRAMPSRHVDYLSHNWREEDIWESWKYIVSRRNDYSNAARLENASWRTWMKSKNNLKTVSPETLNWLKDCDVTWLYGPLQQGHTLSPRQPSANKKLAKSNSFLVDNKKKPILKKRSMSEIMLQRSLSASSLIKQAAAAVQAQQKETVVVRVARPRLERATTDYVTFPLSSHSPGPASLQSTSSSGITSPSSERKHIHFNEQVEQCIAVNVKGDDGDGDDEQDTPSSRYSYDSDSDDDAIMMKRSSSSKRHIAPPRRHSYANHTESKTIAMLPSTTLKYHEDYPELSDLGSAMKHSYRSPVMSPSSSQETLRPSKPSGRMFIVDDDDEEEDEDEEDDDDDDDDDDSEEGIVHHLERQRGGPRLEEEEEEENDDKDEDKDDDDDDDDDDSEDDGIGMSMSGSRRRTGGFLKSSASTSRLGSSHEGLSHGETAFPGSGGGGGGLKRTTSTNTLSVQSNGMRRTPSGMFMPYDEGGSSRLLSSIQHHHRTQ